VPETNANETKGRLHVNRTLKPSERVSSDKKLKYLRNKTTKLNYNLKFKMKIREFILIKIIKHINRGE
jgi:hypothetical protein